MKEDTAIKWLQRLLKALTCTDDVGDVDLKETLVGLDRGYLKLIVAKLIVGMNGRIIGTTPTTRSDPFGSSKGPASMVNIRKGLNTVK
jgi:hypothetical protein